MRLKIKLYADTALWAKIDHLADRADIVGFTTNPSLMVESVVRSYEHFAKRILKRVYPRPVSLEVFTDDFDEMVKEAKKIASWGRNAVVKIPVTNTREESSIKVIGELTQEGIPINVTAVMTEKQARNIAHVLTPRSNAIVSIFAGRIADTGRSPLPMLLELSTWYPVPLLWASARELYNVFQAQKAGCDIITLSPSLIAKLPLIGKDLDEYSLETVQQFHRDGQRYANV